MDIDARIGGAFRAAAIGQEDWCSALSLLVETTGASIGQLAMLDRHGNPLVNQCNLTPDLAREWVHAGGPDPRHNPRTRALLAARQFVSLVDDDFITAAEKARSPIYTGLFRQVDAPHSCLIRIGPAAALATLRPRSAGVASKRDRALIERIAPAAAEALALSLRLGTMIDGAALRTADRLSAAAIVLGYGGGIVALSETAEALLRDGTYLGSRRGRLRTATPAGDAALERAIDAATHDASATRVSRTIVLRCAVGGRPRTAELTPLDGHAHGPLALGHVLLTVSPSPGGAAPATAALAADAGLTAAEADVLERLARGDDAHAIAAARGTALATARTQIKSLLAKTGCRRQVELMARLRDY